MTALSHSPDRPDVHNIKTHHRLRQIPEDYAQKYDNSHQTSIIR